MDDPITRRAIAFAKTFKWVNPRITATGPASPDIVTRFGTADSADYGEIRIEMDWSEDHKSKLLADFDPAQLNDLRTFVDAPTEILVVCSSNDVIYHEILNTDLD